nr:xylulose kinase-1 [Tanacetum cinerariifolium]
MVAYLTKSNASEGFNQIIDFLNGSFIKYALTVNPNIYVSCIKQFWTTVVVKKVNDVMRLQALVDKKKVVVTKATIREALRLDDAKGVECLPNEEIFAELARMGYEKPSTKVVKEGDADGNDETVNAGDAAEGDVSAVHEEVPTADEEPSIPSPTPPTPPPQPSQDILSTSQVQPTPPQSPQVQPPSPQPQPQPQPQQDAGIPINLLQERVETSDETVIDDESSQGRMIAEMDQDADVVLEDDREVADVVKDVEDAKEDKTEPTEVQEVADVVTTETIITEVVTTASETITAANTNITAAKAQVPTDILTTAPARVTAAPSRRIKGVVIRDLQEESTTSTIIPVETKSKDKGKGILAKEDPAVKKYQALKRKPQTEAQARKNMMLYLKNVSGFKMDYFKGMSYDDIRPIFEAKFNSNVAFLLKTNEQIKEDENRALERLNETPAERVAKRRKLNEEVEELKIHLQIVPNEDDDVYTKATPLA